MSDILKDYKEIRMIENIKNAKNYLKQIKELEKENEELKNRKDDYYVKTLDQEAQISDLIQENEELKEKLEKVREMNPYINCKTCFEVSNYKQALKEIREIMENIKGTNTALYMNNTIIDNTARQSIELQARFINNLYKVLESEGK